jgi:hypothetical protein
MDILDLVYPRRTPGRHKPSMDSTSTSSLRTELQFEFEFENLNLKFNLKLTGKHLPSGCTGTDQLFQLD